MNFTKKIKIQDITRNIIINDFEIEYNETIGSIKNRLKKQLLNDNEETLLLHSGKEFLQNETQNSNTLIRDDILYVIIKNNQDYNNIDIESLKNTIEQRALNFAQGIKNRNQNLILTRKKPLFI